MTFLLRTLLLLPLLLAAACSNASIYHAFGDVRAIGCDSVNPRERSACEAPARMSYEEYSAYRQEAQR